MINTLKEILVYNKTTSLNLNTLDAGVKSKIDKVSRVNPTTGQSFQIWSSAAGVFNFASLVCGGVYVIESSSINFTGPYQLSNDGSDDGLRTVNDYNKLICSGGLTPTPTPTPTATPVAPFALFIATDPLQGNPGWYNTVQGVVPLPNSKSDIGGSFSATCQNATLRYNMRNDISIPATSLGELVTIKYQNVLIGIVNFENQYYASTDGGNDGVSVTYTCGCSVYTGKVTSTATTSNGNLSLILVTDQCPTPTPTPTRTPTPTPTGTSSGGINLTATNPMLSLGYPCIPSVQCPPGADDPIDCCGQETNKIHYKTESGLVSYITISKDSVLSFASVLTGDTTDIPKIAKLKIGSNYYGEVGLLTTRYMGRSFQITDGCTRYSGTFSEGDVILSSQTIC